MAILMQDLRFALRSFVRAPRFSIPAILALALGIGATSAILSVVRGVMLEPLPYRDPDRIITIWETLPSRNVLRNVIAPANFVAWRERSQTLEHFAMVGPARMSLMLDGSAEEFAGMTASSETFAALGVRPALGRGFTALEDDRGNDQVMIVSHEFWQTRLGGRSDVIGTTLSANGQPRTIVGIMPEQFTVVGQKAAFLVPYGWTIEGLRAAPGRGISYGIARLRDGVALEQASAEMKTLMATLEKEAPGRNTGWSVTLVPVHEQLVDQIRPALLVLTAGVLLVLLISCVNVANLLLSRGTVRQRELGIRAALGARRRRLLAQLLSESLLLGALGGVTGIGLAAAFHRGLLALVADRIPVPRLDQVALDLPMLGLTVVIALATGVVFGFVPAIVTSGSIDETLREGGRHGAGARSRRILGGLVVAEVALALVLLVSAGLLIRSFARVSNIDPGFTSQGLLTARVQTPAARYPGPASPAFFTAALARISMLPGVEQAAAIGFLPMGRGPVMRTGYYRTDRPTPSPGEAPSTDVRPVTPNLFTTMGVTRIAGRDFNQADRIDSPAVTIVSEALARRVFGDDDPIGHHIQIAVGGPVAGPFEIVGVVRDIQGRSLDGESFAAAYVPHTQLPIGVMTFVVRTQLPPMSLATGLAAAVHDLDPELPLADTQPMDDVVALTIARPRVLMTLLIAFAAMAILLAGVGVYGVMSYAVGERMHELGVRLAVGATNGMVFRMVLGQAFTLAAIGVAVGLIAALASTRLLETLLFDTHAQDPATFGIAALMLMGVALVASYIPARRGTRIALIETLHPEH